MLATFVGTLWKIKFQSEFERGTFAGKGFLQIVSKIHLKTLKTPNTKVVPYEKAYNFAFWTIPKFLLDFELDKKGVKKS